MFGRKSKKIHELTTQLSQSEKDCIKKDLQIQELRDRVFVLENLICPGEQHKWKIVEEEVVLIHNLSNVTCEGKHYHTGPRVNRRLTCSKCFATKHTTTYQGDVMEEEVTQLEDSNI